MYALKFTYRITGVTEGQLSNLMSQVVDEGQDGPLHSDDRQLDACLLFDVGTPEIALPQSQELMRRAFKRASMPYQDPSRIELSLETEDASDPVAA